MPVAIKFESEEVDNGFPYCPSDLDVSSSDLWTSLSGWSKVNTPADDAAKAQSISESLRLAMQLFWNIYEMNGSVSFIESGDSASVTNTGGLLTEPRDRACFVTENPTKTATNSDGDAGVSITFNIKIVRLINNGEFVGFGVAGLSFSATWASDFSISFGRVSLSSEGVEDDGFADEDTDYTVITDPNLGDFHFVCNAFGNVGGNGGTANAVNRTITITSGSNSADAQIDDFDFYTYPT